MKVLLMGVGLQGIASLYDLVHSEAVEHVLAADKAVQSLQKWVDANAYGDKVEVAALDVEEPGSLGRIFRSDVDVAIDLLPPQFIDKVARAALAHRVPLVNAFYTTHSLQEMQDEIKRVGIGILPECGLDPGIDLILLGEAVRSFDELTAVKTYGAGIPAPANTAPPLRYKTSWTLEGVLKSYTTPARVLQGNEVREIGGKALLDAANVHSLVIEGLGVLEAFPNGDAAAVGKAMEAGGYPVANLGRYTLRWPGHIAFWKPLIDMGFLDEAPVWVGGDPVNRIRYLAELIGPQIQYGEQERDVALVRVEVEGIKGGAYKKDAFQVMDMRDMGTGLSAMSRTVGFTTSIAAQMLVRGDIEKTGLLTPLWDIPYKSFTEELERRGIEVEVFRGEQVSSVGSR